VFLTLMNNVMIQKSLTETAALQPAKLKQAGSVKENPQNVASVETLKLKCQMRIVMTAI